MRALLAASLAALALALPYQAMADAQFRMQIPSVIMGIGGDGSGPPDHGTSSPVEIYASDASGRAPNAISIPVTIAGATGTEVVTLDAPSGAAWIPDGAGSGTISWPSAMIGTHEVTIHVADAGGQEKASKTISLIVHGPLTASVPQSTYLPKVGDALAIAPTVQNLIAGPGSARWGASPAPFPSWLALDDVSGTVAVDTTTAHVAAELELTAVDQTDMASASTEPFSVGVAPIVELGATTLPNAKEAIAYADFDLSTLATVAGTDKSGMAWSATGLPAGMSVDAATGALGGVPAAGTSTGGAAGSYDFTVVASKMGGDGQRTYTIEVGGTYLAGVTQISSRADHACAVASGSAYCWGLNSTGQLGNGSNTSSPTPVQVSGLTGVTYVTAGYYHSCAIANGGAWCWGQNTDGRLGNGTTTSSTTPVQVSGLTSGVTQVSAYYNHTCAIVSGSAKCWGENGAGKLGNGTTNNSSSPVQVSGLTSGITYISVGLSYSCAVVSGSAKCWGGNGYGVLGNGNTTSSLTPVQVAGLTSGVTKLEAIYFHTCAIQSGALKCWGYNGDGQLGNNTTTDSTSPVQVNGLTGGVTQIAGEFYRTCAIHNGAAKCWGRNNFGQLGDGTTTKRSVPVQVNGLTSGVTQIVAGGDYSCALLSAGGVKCWGSNYSGRLGDGTNTDRLTPVQVLAP